MSQLRQDLTYLPEPRLRHHAVAVSIMLAACLACYVGVLDAPFVFDDLPNISENPAIQVSVLDQAQLTGVLRDSLMPSRPVANLSFALNYYLAGLDTSAFRITNIAIHFINGLLVYVLAMLIYRRSSRSGYLPALTVPVSWPALLAAVIFIVHPVQIQSVTYIVQRMNSLATMFYLMALVFYLLGRMQTNRYYRLYFLLVPVCWLLSLGCKEIAATLPAAVLLCEWCCFQSSFTGFVRQHRGLVLILLGVTAAVAFYLLGGDPIGRVLNDYRFRDFSLAERLLTESRVIIFYISLVLLPLPSRLNLLHDVDVSTSLLSPLTTLPSLVMLTTAFILAIIFAGVNRLLSFGMFWYFLHLLIESSFIGLELLFEHRLYLPMAGILITGSWFVFAFPMNREYVRAGVVITLVACLGLATVERNQAWSSSESLWQDVLSKNPGSYRAHYNLANELSGQARFDEAMAHYNRTIQLKPGYAKAHNNLGIVLKQLGNTSAAIGEYVLAARYDPGNYRTYYNLGIAYGETGQFEQAMQAYRQALQINPGYAQAHYNLANLLDRLGRDDEAVQHLQLAIRSDPLHVLAYNNLAIILARQGKYSQANGLLQTALQIDPDMVITHINLGNVLYLTEQLIPACRHYREALSRGGDIPVGVRRDCGF